jgi:hypothetical protein
MNDIYKESYFDALAMMFEFDELEPTSAFKQCAHDRGIPFGLPMQRFITWARKKYDGDL